ncbi:MAG: hypothetical protein VYE73_01315 [Acidobacteriota bacterium]|nr:hypothetical protein [Acidobacteriota bacterium]
MNQRTMSSRWGSDRTLGATRPSRIACGLVFLALLVPVAPATAEDVTLLLGLGLGAESEERGDGSIAVTGGGLEALKRRHSYGAADNVVLDFQEEHGGRHYIMGDVVETEETPKLRIRVLGTDDETQLVVVKNQALAFQTRPARRDVDLEFVDQGFDASRDNYYYVRVLQTDGNLAWSSPIWFEHR